MNSKKTTGKPVSLCRIKSICIIVAFISTCLLVSSCGVHSVRVDSKSYAKIRNKEAISRQEDNKDLKNIQESPETDSPETVRMATSSNIETPETEKQPSHTSDIATNSSQSRKIPTLREQMKIYTSEQEAIKEKISNMQDDVDDIKTAVLELKEAVKSAPNVKFKSAESGSTYIDETYMKPDEEVALLPDEEEEAAAEDDSVILPDQNARPRTSSAGRVATEHKPAAKARKSKASTKSSTPSKRVQKAQADIAYNASTVPGRKSRRGANADRNSQAEKNPAPVVNSQASDQMLQPALNLIRAKDYRNAIIELNNVLEKTKDPCITGTANYWLGESYFALKQFDRSIACLNKVLQTKGCAKKDNAQMMIAESLIRTGQVAEAKRAFQDLIANYPQSEYIPRARKMLQQI